jgi:hypothetical protein
MSGYMMNRFRGQVAEDYEPDDRDEREVEAARTQYDVARQIAAAGQEAAADAEALRVALALIPAGMRFRTKDDLYRHLTTIAKRRHDRPLRDSERQQLFRASFLLWANGDVHETTARVGALLG